MESGPTQESTKWRSSSYEGMKPTTRPRPPPPNPGGRERARLTGPFKADRGRLALRPIPQRAVIRAMNWFTAEPLVAV